MQIPKLLIVILILCYGVDIYVGYVFSSPPNRRIACRYKHQLKSQHELQRDSTGICSFAGNIDGNNLSIGQCVLVQFTQFGPLGGSVKVSTKNDGENNKHIETESLSNTLWSGLVLSDELKFWNAINDGYSLSVGSIATGYIQKVLHPIRHILLNMLLQICLTMFLIE
jgi:hypothetical protein